MTTALEAARQYFENAIERGVARVTNTELRVHVCNVTGQHREVVHGTLDSIGYGSLYDAEWYKTLWRKETTDNGRVVHRRKDEAMEEPNYDTPRKRAALKRIVKCLPVDGAPAVVTTVIDADLFLEAVTERNPSTTVDKVAAIGDIRGGRYDLAHVDTGGGYVSRSLCEALACFNAQRTVKVLALTVACLDKFRNTGVFQQALREKYAGQPDQHAACIADCLDQYDMIDRFAYQRDAHALRLEVFIFCLSTQV